MQASEIADRLAQRAEAVCRHYLSKGRREGGYWRVGDLANTPGRSLFVSLIAPNPGKWSDAATGDHGDLLDVIAAHLGGGVIEAMAEARNFLSLPADRFSNTAARRTTPEAARRLLAAARPIGGTPAETYLRRRGLDHLRAGCWLRYHPRCFHRIDGRRGAGPALLAAATDLVGTVQGLQRLWLTQDGAKAPFADPRRSMGRLRSHAVRVGAATDVMLAGEGIETVLSVRQVLPLRPVAAALSAANLAAVELPPTLRRLYVAADNDAAGHRGAGRLSARARAQSVDVVQLRPRHGDFNDDLMALGREAFARQLRGQIRPEDWAGFSRSGA